MSLFKDMLKADESLFLNELALDIEYMPPIIKYRENQQSYIAECIKPLFYKRNGKNLLITGKPGIGKTIAVKYLFNELKKETDDVEPIYINCWKQNTPYKIAVEICKQINYKWIQNRKTDELLKEIAKILNKKSVVFCLDEVDKLQDNDIIYSVLEDIYKKTILFITNGKHWLINLDKRLKSRLMPELLEFKPYNYEETFGIIKQRVELALVKDVVNKDVLDLITKKTFELEDIRSALFLIREAANVAENKASKKILKEHAEQAIEKLPTFKIKKSTDLQEEEKLILDIIKNNSGKRLKEIYTEYKSNGGLKTYRTFHRKIKTLQDTNMVSIKEIKKIKGKSYIVEYRRSSGVD